MFTLNFRSSRKIIKEEKIFFLDLAKAASDRLRYMR